MLKQIDEPIDEYLRDLDHGDKKEEEVKEYSARELREKIEPFRRKREKYSRLQGELEQSNGGQISLTDADSRMMRTRWGKDVCYNAKITTDSKHHLIVTNEVTNELNDMQQLHSSAREAKEVLEVEEIKVVADAGLFERDNVKKCHDDRIETYLPRPCRSHNRRLGLYTNRDFIYDGQKDAYRCPGVQLLTFYGVRKYKRSGTSERIYTTGACHRCPLKSKSTRSKGTRRIARWEHEELIEQLDQRVRENADILKRRKGMVEHPFATIKNWMGHYHFLTRGKENVSTEFNLFCLAHNIKRVLKTVDFQKLMACV